jgi:hypothetical protein
MDRKELVEIKKGQTGTGLLIENDGYISLDLAGNRKLFVDISSARKEGDFYCPHPLIFNAVLQRYGAENANGRIYPEAILKREVDKYQEKIRERRAIAELNHPSESTIDLSRVAINIAETWSQGNTLCGKVEIITSPGFRKYGIISCEGDQTANLLLEGIKIGLSSRGLGSETSKRGVLMVEDDYELVGFDVVSDPSTHNAWFVKEDEIPRQYLESKESDGSSKLLENLRKFDKWLND